MEEPDLGRLEELFQRAADLPRGEREGFVAEHCAGDPALAGRLRALLARLEDDASLASPVLGAAAEDEAREGPGATIGRYKLLQEIGEGGYGVVYLAEQSEPVRRRVALKVIKAGMDSREVVARFEAERQALALMDHPNIAKVLDGGATDSGRPYFVMELVRGVSLTEYCDRERLGTRERLELFVDVCHAIQHAHTKGVIHRDVKPSNVMVTLHDGRPVAKVIDFGIAKALHGPLTDKTLFTAYQRFIGTPAYMSPEQAEMSGLDVDARSDIYALGVLLYELLTGATPFDAHALLEEGLLGIQKILREREPLRPSQRISTSADADVADRRRLDLAALVRRVRGDLDWIVMKALEKDRERRYGTASELAADVRRHLTDEPVEASPPSAVYRTRKFLVRNRTAVLWAAVLFLALAAGVVATGISRLEVGRQRDEARREARRAQAVTEFLVDTLALADPEVARDPNASVVTLLGRAAEQVETALADEPVAEARVRATIGNAYATLGLSARAERQLRRADELQAGRAEIGGVERYRVLWALTEILFRLEEPDALATAQRARQVAHETVGAVHPELGEVLGSFVRAVDEAAHSTDPDSIDAAGPLFEETVRRSDEALPPGDPLWELVAGSYMHAGYDLWYGMHEASSIPYWRRVLEIQRRERGADAPEVAATVTQLVTVLNRAGRLDEAEELMRETVARLRAAFPDGSFQLALSEAMLGENLVAQGRFDEAEALLVGSHDVIASSVESESGFYTVDSYTRLIDLYEGQGDRERAEDTRRGLVRAIDGSPYLVPHTIAHRAFGPEGPEGAEGGRGLVEAFEELAGVCGPIDFSAAEGALGPDGLRAPVDAIVAASQRFSDDDLLGRLVGRLLLYRSMPLAPGAGDPLRERMLTEARRFLEPAAEVHPLELGELHAQLARIAHAAGEREAADEHARRALELLGPAGEGAWYGASARVRAARCLLAIGRLADAEAQLVPSYHVYVAHLGGEHSSTRTVAGLAAELYAAWDRPAEAERFRAASKHQAPGATTGRPDAPHEGNAR